MSGVEKLFMEAIMNENQSKAWGQLTDRMKQVNLINSSIALLHWDQQTYMPPRGAELRGAQVGTLSGITHGLSTAPEVGDWIQAVGSGQLDTFHTAAVRNIKKAYEREAKMPAELVQKFSEAQATGFTAWMKARNSGDFNDFVPALQNLLDLSRERVSFIKTDEACDYDVLLDQFDPGVSTASLNPIFDRLAAGLGELLKAIDGQPQIEKLGGEWDTDAQKNFYNELIPTLGYSLENGRLDAAQHPFSIKMTPGDTRLTTHYYKGDLLSALGGTMHEAGHGMYEQGLNPDWWNTGVGEAASLGMHESQSRFWENFIGHSMAFCEYVAPQINKHFGSNVTPERLYSAANRVERSFIRVQADEATYNLHIIVRFKLEQALVHGDITVAEAPGVWADLYEEIVGVRPQNLNDGVLQDVHWSGGSFGYFPSYSLGNLYAASLGVKIQEDLPEMWDQVRAGNFSDILGWLRQKVHLRGHMIEAPEIVREAVGERDMVSDLLDHMWDRFGGLYGVQR
jgi:carboxypeptidase Taq